MFYLLHDTFRNPLGCGFCFTIKYKAKPPLKFASLLAYSTNLAPLDF